MQSSKELLDALDSSTAGMDEAVARFLGMFCGDMGTGKTVFAAMLAQMITPPDKKIILVDTSDGWVSLKNHPQLQNRTIRVEFQGLKQIEVLADAILDNHKGFANTGTVILDELSSLASDNLQRVAQRREAKLSDSQKASNPNEGGLERRDYNLSGNMVFRGYKFLYDIPGLNIISLAHVKDKGDDGQTKTEEPTFPADLFRNVARFQHITAMMRGEVKKIKGEEVYVRTIQAHPTIKAPKCKTRVGGLDVLGNDPKVVARIIQAWLQSGGTPEVENYPIKLEAEVEEFTGIITE